MIWEKELGLWVYNETNIWVRLTLDIDLSRSNKIWQPHRIYQLKLDISRIVSKDKISVEKYTLLHCHIVFQCIIIIIIIIINIALALLLFVGHLVTLHMFYMGYIISTIPEWLHSHFLKIVIVHSIYIDQTLCVIDETLHLNNTDILDWVSLCCWERGCHVSVECLTTSLALTN